MDLLNHIYIIFFNQKILKNYYFSKTLLTIKLKFPNVGIKKYTQKPSIQILMLLVSKCLGLDTFSMLQSLFFPPSSAPPFKSIIEGFKLCLDVFSSCNIDVGSTNLYLILIWFYLILKVKIVFYWSIINFLKLTRVLVFY